MKKIIHINQHIMRSNRKTGKMEPVITVKSGKKNEYCHEVEILGPSKLVYTPNKPLNCGATCYILVDKNVEVKLTNKISNELVECQI